MPIPATPADTAAFAASIEHRAINLSAMCDQLARTTPDDIKPFLIVMAAAAENLADKAHCIEDLSE